MAKRLYIRTEIFYYTTLKQIRQLVSILFTSAFYVAPCNAQFATLSNIYKGPKATMQAQKARKQAQKE